MPLDVCMLMMQSIYALWKSHLSGFHATVALARNRNFCSMNGNDMLDAEVKIGGPVSRLRAR
jgi:hypothetical protein